MPSQALKQLPTAWYIRWIPCSRIEHAMGKIAGIPRLLWVGLAVKSPLIQLHPPSNGSSILLHWNFCSYRLFPTSNVSLIFGAHWKSLFMAMILTPIGAPLANPSVFTVTLVLVHIDAEHRASILPTQSSLVSSSITTSHLNSGALTSLRNATQSSVLPT